MSLAQGQRLTGRDRRRQRIHKRVSGSAGRPRLCVYRSLRHVHAQLVDDESGRVLLGASSVAPVFAHVGESGKGKREVARVVGRELAKRALERGVEAVVFDRSGYRYHGRVRALAEGAREGGLRF